LSRVPLDVEDDLYDPLAVREGPWAPRSSEPGEEFRVTREQLAELLADGRRQRRPRASTRRSRALATDNLAPRI
jgi:hypothetical protein